MQGFRDIAQTVVLGLGGLVVLYLSFRLASAGVLHSYEEYKQRNRNKGLNHGV